jgi:hypothetical protein
MAVNRAEDGGHNDRAPLISREARLVPVSGRLRGYWKTVSLDQRRARKCWRRTTCAALLQTPCRPEPDWPARFLASRGRRPLIGRYVWPWRGLHQPILHDCEDDRISRSIGNVIRALT